MEMFKQRLMTFTNAAKWGSGVVESQDFGLRCWYPLSKNCMILAYFVNFKMDAKI